MSQGGHSETLLLFHFFTRALLDGLKLGGGVGWGGGPGDFSVSPSPFGLDFGTLDFGTLDSGLTIFVQYQCLSPIKLIELARLGTVFKILKVRIFLG